MKSIRIAIMNLSYFREVVKTPRYIEVPDDANILDILYMLDMEYWEKMKGVPHSKRKMHFYDDKIHFLMQLLWDPNNLRFCEDVGIDTWYDPPTDESIPIEKDWKINLPPNSRIVLTPDAGC
jgi:hypothetical protein